MLAAIADGTLGILVKAGASVLAPGCGPLLPEGTGGLLGSRRTLYPEPTISNFVGRMGSQQAEIYLASPATVAALAIAGTITDPRSMEVARG